MQEILLHPSQIKWRCAPELKNQGAETVIKAGDWDLHPNDFDSTVLFYDALNKKINDFPFADWTDTAYYKDAVEQIKAGKRMWECSDVYSFNSRLRGLEKIFFDIIYDGYDTSKYNFGDGIGVNIDRHGRLLFNNGRHRLSILKILNTHYDCSPIPIEVNYIHPEWQSFVDKIDRYSKRTGEVYTHIPHAYLMGKHKTHFDNLLNKAITIIPKIEGLKVLDIGAHWGYYSHVLSHFNQVTAVENDLFHLEVLNKLNIAADSPFEVKGVDFLDQDWKGYDFALAFNIFHHFIKKERDFNRFRKVLSTLDVKEMLFVAHNPSEGQMNGAWRNFNPEEFVEFIIKNSPLQHSEFIANINPGDRKMYRLWREK